MANKKERFYGYYKITRVYQMFHNDDGRYWVQYFYDLENVITQEYIQHITTGTRKLNRNKTHYGYVHNTGIYGRFTRAKEPESTNEVQK
jgi:hypothetical protein